MQKNFIFIQKFIHLLHIIFVLAQIIRSTGKSGVLTWIEWPRKKNQTTLRELPSIVNVIVNVTGRAQLVIVTYGFCISYVFFQPKDISYFCWVCWDLFRLSDILHHIFTSLRFYLVELSSAQQMRLFKHNIFMPKIMLAQIVESDPSSTNQFNCNNMYKVDIIKLLLLICYYYFIPRYRVSVHEPGSILVAEVHYIVASGKYIRNQ
jgi:hypothetical protein